MRYPCFLALHPDNIRSWNRGVMQADDDVIALSDAIHVYPLPGAFLDDGRQVCHFMFDTRNANAAHLLVDSQDTFEEYAQALHIETSYLGQTPDEVRENTGQDFRETVSYTDEDGKEAEYEVDLLKHEWR